jgi:hypothetical protein
MLKPSEPASADYSRRPFPTLPPTHEPRLAMHTNSSEREMWGRVKQRLRVEVGDEAQRAPDSSYLIEAAA